LTRQQGNSDQSGIVFKLSFDNRYLAIRRHRMRLNARKDARQKQIEILRYTATDNEARRVKQVHQIDNAETKPTGFFLY